MKEGSSKLISVVRATAAVASVVSGVIALVWGKAIDDAEFEEKAEKYLSKKDTPADE